MKDREIKLQWLEMFNDYKEFHNKHFMHDGWNMYDAFRKQLEGYHYIEIIVDGEIFVNENDELIKHDIFSCRIVGGDNLVYIRVDYDVECSHEEIFECYIVEEKEITMKHWVRND